MCVAKLNSQNILEKINFQMKLTIQIGARDNLCFFTVLTCKIEGPNVSTVTVQICPKTVIRINLDTPMVEVNFSSFPIAICKWVSVCICPFSFVSGIQFPLCSNNYWTNHCFAHDYLQMEQKFWCWKNWFSQSARELQHITC